MLWFFKQKQIAISENFQFKIRANFQRSSKRNRKHFKWMEYYALGIFSKTIISLLKKYIYQFDRPRSSLANDLDVKKKKLRKTLNFFDRKSLCLKRNMKLSRHCKIFLLFNPHPTLSLLIRAELERKKGIFLWKLLPYC